MIRDDFFDMEHYKYEGLPILWVNAWEDVTPSLLEREWTRMLQRAHSYDMRRLYSPIWVSDLLQFTRPHFNSTSAKEACSQLMALPQRGASISPGAWLQSAEKGHCGYTESKADCDMADRGSLGLSRSAGHFSSWHQASAACLAKCAQCSRCRYVTVSVHHEDCSWYSSCRSNTFSKAVAFRSAAAFEGLSAVEAPTV